MQNKEPLVFPADAATAPVRSRLHEIDFVRGIAIVAMVLFHLAFDLVNYLGFDIDVYQGFWFYLGRISAIMFLVVSGISSTLGKRALRRAFVVLGAALIVTVASIFTMGDNYIRFGILHFFAAAMLGKALLDKIIKNHWVRLGVALVLIPVSFWLGGVVSNVFVGHAFFLPLGIRYAGFASFDYYPIFPWLAYFCMGVALGLVLYKDKRSLLSYIPAYKAREDGKAPWLMRPLAFLGRHSLLVYLLHQPLILAVLFGLQALGVFG